MAEDKSCNECIYVGSLVYRNGDRRCDYLMHERAPEWMTTAINRSHVANDLRYGPPSRAEECGTFKSVAQGDTKP